MAIRCLSICSYVSGDANTPANTSILISMAAVNEALSRTLLNLGERGDPTF